MSEYHQPVLLKESVDALVTDADGTYVDVTFGGGGHSGEILKRLGKKGKIIAFDQDADAFKNTIEDKRFMLIRGNFRYIKNFLRYHDAIPVTGVLADLGISSHQIDTSDRGFSTRFDANLDMRMNNTATLSAAQVVNEYPEEKLRDIFRDYSDLREARNIAKKIVAKRSDKKIETTGELMEILKSETHRGQEFQFFARVFQGLRIEVNRELDALKELLIGCKDVINAKGRLVVISYHSMEDRLVKNFIAAGNFSGEMERDAITGQPAKTEFLPLNKKPVEPLPEEIENNSRARSARMRVAIKQHHS
jgi:16S rRNA (cytosine1402-N4)-methyltransferase